MRSRLDALERKLGRGQVSIIILQYRTPDQWHKTDYQYTQSDLERIEQAEQEATRTGKPQHVFIYDHGEQNS